MANVSDVREDAENLAATIRSAVEGAIQRNLPVHTKAQTRRRVAMHVAWVSVLTTIIGLIINVLKNNPDILSEFTGSDKKEEPRSETGAPHHRH